MGVRRLLAAEVSALFLHFPLSFCHLLRETTTADQMGDGKGVALVASRILLLSLALSRSLF